jgi:hypothetical protein
MDLADLVSGIFAFQGFALVEVTRGGPGGSAGVIVRRGPLEIAIAVVPGSGQLDEGRVQELLGELAARPQARHLIAHPGTYSAGARAAAALTGAVLWDRERLVAEAGAGLVATADPDPFHPSGVGAALDDLAQGAVAQAGAREGRSSWPGASGARAAGRAGPARRRTLAPARAGDGDVVLGAMALRVDEAGARQMAQEGRGEVIRVALEWVPAFLIDYHVVAEVTTPRHGQTVLVSGTLFISAASGESEEVDGPVEVVPPRQLLDKAALTRALSRRRLTIIEARERARAVALARTDRTVEARLSDAGTTVTETHRVRPRGTDVDLLSRGVVLLPYYLIEVAHGLVTVNGATGQLVRVAPFAGEGGPP